MTSYCVDKESSCYFVLGRSLRHYGTMCRIMLTNFMLQSIQLTTSITRLGPQVRICRGLASSENELENKVLKAQQDFVDHYPKFEERFLNMIPEELPKDGLKKVGITCSTVTRELFRCFFCS